MIKILFPSKVEFLDCTSYIHRLQFDNPVLYYIVENKEENNLKGLYYKEYLPTPLEKLTLSVFLSYMLESKPQYTKEDIIEYLLGKNYRVFEIFNEFNLPYSDPDLPFEMTMNILKDIKKMKFSDLY